MCLSLWNHCVCDTLALRRLTPLDIRHYVFQSVNVMTTCVYLISLESLQSSGDRLCFAWLGIEQAFPNPWRLSDNLQTASEHVTAVLISVSAGVGACILACLCVCLHWFKSQGSQVGVWAHSDMIEFIKGKSYLCFPWRSCSCSDISTERQADIMVPVALIQTWLHPKPGHVFLTCDSCFRAWARVMVQCEAIKFVHQRKL